MGRLIVQVAEKVFLSGFALGVHDSMDVSRVGVLGEEAVLAVVVDEVRLLGLPL